MLSYFNFLQDVPVGVSYAIAMHSVALLIVGTLALILAAGMSSADTGNVRRWRWFGWFAMLKGAGVVASLAMGTNCADASRYFFEAVYMSATLPAWLAGAQFAWGTWRGRPEWVPAQLPVILWLGMVGGALVIMGWRGLEVVHVALAFGAGFLILGALIREARALERQGFGLGIVSLTLVAGGLTGLLGLECLGWSYYGRFQGWTLNTLPFFVEREFGLMVAGTVFAGILATGWWLWMRQHVVRSGTRGWLKHALWLVPASLVVMCAAGFTVLNRIKIEGGERADRIFELRLRTVRLGLEMAGLQSDAGGPALVMAMKRQAVANPDIDTIAFVRMEGGRMLTVVSTSNDIGVPDVPYAWRDRGRLDERFVVSREPFSSSFMQDEDGAFCLYAEPWPRAGEGWLLMRVSFQQWSDTMGPVLVQTTFIILLAIALAVSAVVYLIQRELGMDTLVGYARADAASRAKTELLARASHELRTPIQGVLGYADLLERSSLEPEQKEWVQAVRNQGGHLLRLVNDLLDYGALQSGRLTIEADTVSILKIARDAMAVVRPQAEARHLTCVVAVDDSVPERVLGDATRLRQVLVNLLGNAVKFTERGEVRLGVSAREEDGCWRLSFEVTDTGMGIGPDELPWIFDSPRRSRRNPTEGAGLGLALARGLCQAMGGDIEVRSELGAGSTFTATVLLARAVVAAEAAAAGPEALPRLGQRVLVVEDNTALRHLFSAWLRELDCEVVLANDGETALAKSAGVTFDVVVLDLGLPGIDGREVARRLRARSGGARVWIVGLSAHASEEDRKTSLDAGMDVFLSKPVELHALAQALQRERAPAVAQSAGGWLQSPMLRGAETIALHAAARAETPAIVEELRAAVAAGNWKKVAGAAHYLCNTADVLGEAELRAACCDCENAAREGRTAEAASAAERVARIAMATTSADASV